jgi:hypothetical protein
MANPKQTPPPTGQESFKGNSPRMEKGGKMEGKGNEENRKQVTKNDNG